MSRSGYSDDYDDDWYPAALWRGAVASAIRGKRGQAFLREMAAALDAMPVKRLIASELQTANGEVCVLGAVSIARGLPVAGIDPEDSCAVAKAFGISEALVREIVFENDDDFAFVLETTPEKRWTYMRAWVAKQITPTPSQAAETKNALAPRPDDGPA